CNLAQSHQLTTILRTILIRRPTASCPVTPNTSHPVARRRMVAPTTRPYISAPMTRRFTRLAWTAATFTYLLVILGAIVRITGSGLGCGEHWPLCNGKLLPPLDLPTMIEYGHRLAAAAVSGLVTALAAYSWWLRRDA